MLFIRVFSMSSIIALVSILSMAYKEFFLNKESNLFIDYTIIISTVLYFIFIVTSIILYFVQRKDDQVKEYRKTFFTLVICIPVFVILFNVYITYN